MLCSMCTVAVTQQTVKNGGEWKARSGNEEGHEARLEKEKGRKAYSMGYTADKPTPPHIRCMIISFESEPSKKNARRMDDGVVCVPHTRPDDPRLRK